MTDLPIRIERERDEALRDAEAIQRERDAVAKLYRLEFVTAACDSCGGHRQSRYVAVDEPLMTREDFIDSLKGCPIIDVGDDNQWVMVDLGPWNAALGEDAK